MMTFRYSPPDFAAPRLAAALDAWFVPAPECSGLPDNFLATSDLLTYVKHAGEGRGPRKTRMDGAIVPTAIGDLVVREVRRIAFGATALHAIAVDNMLPASVETGGADIRPLTTICVDQRNSS